VLPSLIEMFSHCFFIGGYLVGPQFSMRKYKDYIRRNIHEDIPSSVKFGLTRFFIGACYLVGHLVNKMLFEILMFMFTLKLSFKYKRN
jgi:lysophospholipid acyltransferase 5